MAEVVPTRSPDVSVRFHRRGSDAEAELVAADGVEVTPKVVQAAVDLLRELRMAQPGGVHLHLAADHPVDVLDPLPEEVADAAGLPHRRDLYELRRRLPVPADHRSRRDAPPITVRSFAAETDADAWLRVNNRSFAEHPDQGRETAETLAERMAEGWYDPSGFLVLDDVEHPGELTGFCWTKVHPPTATDPELGEIYVIGVDPRHHGRGLGRSLVLAGLDHLAERGTPVANLYVDATNDAARRLYARLGFHEHRRRRVYTS